MLTTGYRINVATCGTTTAFADRYPGKKAIIKIIEFLCTIVTKSGPKPKIMFEIPITALTTPKIPPKITPYFSVLNLFLLKNFFICLLTIILNLEYRYINPSSIKKFNLKWESRP